METLRTKKMAYGKALSEYAKQQAIIDEAQKKKDDLEKARLILTDQPYD